MKKTGFTLIELIITIAVLSTLLAVAVPQFQSTSSNSRLTAAINSLSGDFAFARTEAVKRAIPVTVTAVNASDWATGGWVTAINVSGVTTNLRISPAISGGATISAPVTSVQFNANGRSNSGTLTFKLCDNRNGSVGKKITLNSTGQTFLETKQTCP